ncbi:hypothetical protein GSH19_01360 [Lactobacillus sp. S2-2]|uniref:MucBP domain-containing protein n=1 Tax=Lactobacillus sp. S2-2 TaxID=2692917 RepID=UPI001F2EEF5A|nr:MucBP domain-containing protein [Lactobacillus sp. S2-2]MCF6514829.1 hypothetical protein [Lactobacillus sp. S2-2]
MNYIDEKAQIIKQPDVIYGKIGDKIKLVFPKFENFILSKISDFKLRFTKEPQKINIIYLKKMGQPVIFYYFDYDNYKMIKKPDFKYDVIESNYSSKPPQIDQYKIYLTSGNQNGIISNKVQTINYYYRLKNWQIVQKINYFVKLKNNVFPSIIPEGKILKDKLPINSIWKAFITVKTEKDIWFNLGGNQWIKAIDLTIVTNNSNIYLPNDSYKISNSQKIHKKGIVNFIPNKSIQVFDKPYGKKINNFCHNEIITIDEIIKDENNLIWYHIPNNGYVIKNYINIIKKDD